MIVFPQPWPRPEPIGPWKHETEEGIVEVVTVPDGGFAISVTDPTGRVRRYRSQPISVRGSGRALLEVLVWKERFEVRLNKRLVNTSESIALPSPFLLHDDGEPFRPPEFVANLDVSMASNQEEELFLGALCEIRDNLGRNTRYAVIRTGGLLRQLLLDGSPLITVINRRYKLDLRYEVTEGDGPPVPTRQHWVLLDGATFGGKTEKLRLAAFLSKRCGAYEGKALTVRDIVKVCANVKGGVHLGKPSGDQQQAASRLDYETLIAGKEPTLRCLASIARCVLRAMEPLVAAIAKGGPAQQGDATDDAPRRG